MHPISDYHMHTPLCGHAQGDPSEYAQHAVDIGLKEIGFSDHAPLVTHVDANITMSFAELPKYYKMIEDVRDQFKDRLTIKIGLEADFIVGFEDITSAIIEEYPYDYVIGSVHYIHEWGFDNPAEQDKWETIDIDETYKTYYSLLRRSAQSGMYNIMGHVDLVKKFGHRPISEMSDEIHKTADVFKQCGVAVEINTAGLRKPVKEIYPSLDALKIYCEKGVPLTFGSDAHKPDEVGADYDKGLQLAKEAGYKEYVLFKDRKIEETVPLI